MSLVDEGCYSTACSPKAIEDDFSIPGPGSATARERQLFELFNRRICCNRKKLNWLHHPRPYERHRCTQITDRDHIGASKIGTTARNRRVKRRLQTLSQGHCIPRGTCDRLLRVVPVAPLPSWRPVNANLP